MPFQSYGPAPETNQAALPAAKLDTMEPAVAHTGGNDAVKVLAGNLVLYGLAFYYAWKTIRLLIEPRNPVRSPLDGQPYLIGPYAPRCDAGLATGATGRRSTRRRIGAKADRRGAHQSN